MTTTKGDLKLVEKDVADLASDLADLAKQIENVDLSKLDLEMPDQFQVRVYANRRMLLVRDANTTRLSMAANKLPAPDQFERLERVYKATCLEIYLIDQKFPEAVKASKEFMALAADEEQIDQERRQAAVKEHHAGRNGRR